MKTTKLLVLPILLSALTTVANTIPLNYNSGSTTISATPFTGYRYDIFQWSTPMGSCSTDPKLSELTWKNHIFETGVKVETKPEDKNFNFLGQLKYGIILNQSNRQDSDWDNLGEFSKVMSSVKGNVFDLSGAIGVSRQVSSVLATYYFGMDYTNYQIKDYGLNYKVNRSRYGHTIEELGQVNPKSQLVSKYSFNNYAPWIGSSFLLPLTEKFSVKPTIKGYLFYLTSKADWILRDDYKHPTSFTDKAFGTGVSFDTELLYQYHKNLDIYTKIEIKMLKMLNGRKKNYAYNDNTLSHDLKKLSFMSSSISGGIKYKF